MLITVDIGNTLIKMGLFEGSRLVKHETFNPQAVEKALDVYSDWSNYSTRSIGIASGAIDASHYGAGVYLAKILSGSNEETVRLIKY